jgi:hypothetical protein
MYCFEKCRLIVYIQFSLFTLSGHSALCNVPYIRVGKKSVPSVNIAMNVFTPTKIQYDFLL